jgi:hypothetical protein
VLGHPELTRPAPRDGLVDLSALPDSWMLQSFAMSRSRYFAGSASAGSAMAFAFMVPATHLNATDWYVGEPEDRVLTPTVTLKDGRRLRLRELQQSGWLNSIRIRQGLETGDVVSVEHPDVGDMVRSVELIHAETAGLNGWRPEPPLCQVRPDNRPALSNASSTFERQTRKAATCPGCQPAFLTAASANIGFSTVTRSSIIRSVWRGVGVKRSRSVPAGTVG